MRHTVLSPPPPHHKCRDFGGNFSKATLAQRARFVLAELLSCWAHWDNMWAVSISAALV